MEEQEANLTTAYNRLRELNIEMSSEEFIKLSKILCNLANTQFKKGLDVGFELFKTK